MIETSVTHFVKGEGVPGNKVWVRIGIIQLIIEVKKEFPEYSEGIRTILITKNEEKILLSTEYKEFCRRLFS